MLLIKARVEGPNVAPAIPSSARAAISIPGVVEKAATTEATPNPAAPIKSTLRTPVPLCIPENPELALTASRYGHGEVPVDALFEALADEVFEEASRAGAVLAPQQVQPVVVPSDHLDAFIL